MPPPGLAHWVFLVALTTMASFTACSAGGSEPGAPAPEGCVTGATCSANCPGDKQCLSCFMSSPVTWRIGRPACSCDSATQTLSCDSYLRCDMPIQLSGPYVDSECKQPAVLPTGDAGPDHDAGVDASDAGACPEPLAAVCATSVDAGVFGAHCADTWSAALSDTHYCGMAVSESEEDCGAYRARIAIYADYGYAYFYDRASGALVAVFSDILGDLRCMGGPADFVLPMCAAPTPLNQCVADSGAD